MQIRVAIIALFISMSLLVPMDAVEVDSVSIEIEKRFPGIDPDKSQAITAFFLKVRDAIPLDEMDDDRFLELLAVELAGWNEQRGRPTEDIEADLSAGFSERISGSWLSYPGDGEAAALLESAVDFAGALEDLVRSVLLRDRSSVVLDKIGLLSVQGILDQVRADVQMDADPGMSVAVFLDTYREQIGEYLKVMFRNRLDLISTSQAEGFRKAVFSPSGYQGMMRLYGDERWRGRLDEAAEALSGIDVVVDTSWPVQQLWNDIRDALTLPDDALFRRKPMPFG